MKVIHHPLKPDDILAGHTPAIVAVADKLRTIIKAAIPEATEVAYPVWHAIGYRHPEAGYFCGIFPYKDHIKIYFEYGRFLPNDDKLLMGEGRQTKYIFIHSSKDIKVAAFKKLLKASINFRKNLPPKKNLKSSFPLRFPPSLTSFGRAGKARRAEGGCGGNSARRAQRAPFGYFQTDTAVSETNEEGERANCFARGEDSKAGVRRHEGGLSDFSAEKYR